MSKYSFSKHLLQSTVLAGMAMAVAMPAFAQDEDEGDTIVVTGSKIPRADLEGPSPVAVYDEEAIQTSGTVSIGRLLREIPSVAGGAQTTTINNGGGGSEQISLRGLGSERTLVLVNGRRVPDSSAGLSGQVDLQTIPVSLIKRVEVLKSGASTVYGADAVAGVVNVILKDDFEGFELSFQEGISSEDDASSRDLAATFGARTENGGFAINFSKTDDGAVSAGDREFAATALDLIGGELVPGGSSAPPWGRYFVPSLPGSQTLGPDFSGGSNSGFRPFTFANDAYNFAPINFQKQPVDRWSATFIGDHQVAPLSGGNFFVETEAFAEVSYIDRESLQRLAEVPLAPFAFFGFDAPISADNGFNPFGEDITDWRRRLVEAGGRTNDIQVQTFRTVVGLRGEVAGNWDWELTYSYGDVDQTSAFGPIINFNNVAEAVGPTALDGGVLRCDTDGDGVFTAADNADCVPFNPFGQNSVTQEMIDFIGFTQNESTSATSEMISFEVVKPDLFSLPAGDVGAVVGYVHRSEEGEFTPDALVASLGAAASGTPSQATVGGYELDEFYAEARIPVLSGQPLAEQLDFEVGLRYSDYDTFGDTTNYKVGVEYRPVDELLLRASANTSFRAPQINDLFGGNSFSFPSVTDPCSSNPTPSCIANGVPSGGFTQPSSQVRTQVGGNASVQPEESENFTAGAIWQPSAVDGLSLGVDYFQYEVTNPITTAGASVILTQCAATGAFCDQIDRFTSGPNVGAPLLIRNLTTNAGRIDAEGYDLFAEWSGIEVPTGGTLDLKWEGTIYETYDKTESDGTITEHAGFLRDDGDGLFSEARWSSSASYEHGPFNVVASVRHIAGVSEFAGDLFGRDCETDNLPGIDAGLSCVTAASTYGDQQAGNYFRKIDNITYLDLYGSYDFDLGNSATQVYLGVDNVLDEEPPLSVDAFNDNTDVRTYDTIGRYFYAGFRSKF